MLLIIKRILIISLLVVPSARAATDVYVAAYEFPPFYSSELDQHLVGELVTSLNFMQTEYRFIIREIPVTGRYQALAKEGCCDLIFFESMAWGWHEKIEALDINIERTKPLLRGGERFVARKEDAKDINYFADYSGKRLGGVAGYHYPFATTGDENMGQERDFGVYLSDSHMTNIRMLLNGRLDMIMLTDEFISSLEVSPEGQDFYHELGFSPERYSEYKLPVLVNPDKNLSLEALNALILQLSNEGELDAVFRTFNMSNYKIDQTPDNQTGS